MNSGETVANNSLYSTQWKSALILLCLFACASASRSQTPSTNQLKSRLSVRISTIRAHFRLGENIRLRVEIRNEGDQDVFIFKGIDNSLSNALATLRITMYRGKEPFGPSMSMASDSFSSERSSYPPLANELAKYWIALPPTCFYGGELILGPSDFENLKVPGKYRIQGKYSSRGFLARDINNPLLHYADELKQLPYEAWVGEVETNSVLIEITRDNQQHIR